MTTKNTFIKAHIVQQTNHQLRDNINKQLRFSITGIWMGPLNDENKLQVEEKSIKN